MAPGNWPPPARIAAPLLILWGSLGPALAADRSSEYQVKAAFLVNFARFVEWPSESFGAASDPIVFGVYGKDLFGAALEQAVRGKRVDGHPVEIRRTSEVRALRSCHVVFVPASEMGHFREVSVSLENLSVLLVGETEDFMVRGGVINFILENERVRFEISPPAAARAHLKISSRLLELAVRAGEK
jgi:hypothetical protein